LPARPRWPTSAHAARFVADRVADGADYVKVIVEDPRMPGTAALPGATIRAIVVAAHGAGLLVVAHAVTHRGARTRHRRGRRRRHPRSGQPRPDRP